MAVKELTWGVPKGAPDLDRALQEASKRDDALVALRDLLAKAVGHRETTDNRVRYRVYTHGTYFSNGEVYEARPRIRKAEEPMYEDQQVTDENAFRPKRGGVQEVPCDFTISVNGVKFPRAWIPSPVTRSSRSGPETVMVPSDIRFSQGKITVYPDEDPLFAAILDLHPLNAASVTNKAKAAGIRVVIERASGTSEEKKVLERWKAGTLEFSVVGGSGRDEAEARLAEEETLINAHLAKADNDELRRISSACNANVSTKAATSPDKRGFYIKAIMDVVRTPSRATDRRVVLSMCGEEVRSITQVLLDGIANGNLKIEGNDFAIVEPDGRERRLEGLAIPANQAGNEAEWLALKIQDDDEDLWWVVEAIRESNKADRSALSTDSAKVSSALDKLMGMGIISLSSNKGSYIHTDPATHQETLLFNVSSAATTAKKREKLEDWARRKGIDALNAMMVASDGLPET